MYVLDGSGVWGSLIWPLSGKKTCASSSRVRVVPVMALVPPASDHRMAVRPVGPTSKTSRSSGWVWVAERIATFTSVTLLNPLTLIVEG